MQASFHAESERPRLLLLASQWTHCLADLLQRYSSGELKVDIVGILSNHTGQAAELASKYRVPFEHLDIEESGKAAAEQRILSIMTEREVDLAVLARYMQILSDDFCQQARCPIINIHHSFLPSFKGRSTLSPSLCREASKSSELRPITLPQTSTKGRSSNRM